ncbi:MAG: aspartate/glutamate racemase family protein, partial [Sulfurimonas sp.]|nr:aspartate/glutamate racemase family protein [Sulfurimonas sp.]
ILILGTKATINSKAYEIGLKEKGFNNLQAKATGLFVPIVEEEIYSGEILEATFRHYFDALKKPDAIILGCTHFPLISDAIQNYFSKDTILIHSGDAIVEQLELDFKFSTKYETTKLEFFASENPEALKNVAKQWLNI